MVSSDPDIQLISRTSFAFSTALHEQLQKNVADDNLVFSPLSLALVLLMARFGARHNTAAELDKALKFTAGAQPLDLNELIPFRKGYFELLKSLRNPKETGATQVTVANRLFTGKGFDIHTGFKNITKAVLDINVKQLDLTEDGGKPAADRINKWVSNITNGKINEIVSPDSITEQTQLLLVNAIFFKSPWETPFEPEDTRAETFHLGSGDSIQVDMMFAAERYSYANLERLNAQVVVIPYKGGQFSMHVFIPRETDGLDAFIHELTNVSMENIRRNITTPGNCEEVHLRLPKFKIESTFNLKKPLGKMGARDMFSAFRADFSGISSNDELHVSDVVQKAFIEVNEEGTEAAAASSIQAGLQCMPSITDLRADRPFYFQIVAEQAHVVLFAGTVRRPNEAQETQKTSNDEDESGEKDLDPRIFFATRGGGIKVHSGQKTVKTVLDIKEPLNGIAYDPVKQLIYYSTKNSIYRVNTDGSDALTVLDSPKYSGIRGLALDFVTGNLYGVTKGGTIFVCKEAAAGQLQCATVLSGLKPLTEIALDPNNGTMYWTEVGSIMSAGMDGSDPVKLVSHEIGEPVGITIDFNSSRILWVDSTKNMIQSSNLDGSDVETLLSLPSGQFPYGIALYADQIYWSNYGMKKLQRSDRSGRQVHTVYSGKDRIVGITSVNGNEATMARQNDCEGQMCPNICVLSGNASRCLP